MSTKTIQAEFRTPEQIRADEEIAWEFEKYLLHDPELRLIVHGVDEERRRIVDEGLFDPNNAIPTSGLNVPFVWNGKVYRVLRATHHNGNSEVEVTPTDPEFVAELRRRIDEAPLHVLTFFQGFGFICFPEDYQRYSG